MENIASGVYVMTDDWAKKMRENSIRVKRKRLLSKNSKIYIFDVFVFVSSSEQQQIKSLKSHSNVKLALLVWLRWFSSRYFFVANKQTMCVINYCI